MWLADENTEFLDKMEKNWSLGNGCNENIVNISLSGNLDMQGHTLELLNVDLKINGLLLNRGPLKWICDNAIIWTQNENKSKIIKN